MAPDATAEPLLQRAASHEHCHGLTRRLLPVLLIGFVFAVSQRLAQGRGQVIAVKEFATTRAGAFSAPQQRVKAERSRWSPFLWQRLPRQGPGRPFGFALRFQPPFPGEEEPLLAERPVLVRSVARTALQAAPTEEALLGQMSYVFGEESVLAAIAAMREGKLVLVVDDANRENEGDLIMAAEKATPESIGFMIRYTSGVICVSLPEERLQALRLPPMVVNNEDPKQTAYSVSVDAKECVTTGISASDRAMTLRSLVDPACTASDFTRPGHMFPLRYKEGGVLRRMGHTEASLDLSLLAGLRPGGVLCEVVNDDGSMMRLDSPNGGLRRFSAEHNLVLTSVQDIAAFRQRHPEAGAFHSVPAHVI